MKHEEEFVEKFCTLIRKYYDFTYEEYRELEDAILTKIHDIKSEGEKWE